MQCLCSSFYHQPIYCQNVSTMRALRSLHYLISLAVCFKDAVSFSVSPIAPSRPLAFLTTTTTTALSSSSVEEQAMTEESAETLPALFPTFAERLDSLGFSCPTPIQQASATRLLLDENMLLIAPTGSGKTLAYLLPALTRAIRNNGTVLVVAPTRELAVQLMRDAMALLKDDDDAVLLTVRGVNLPTPSQLEAATVLIGTPPELLMALTNIRGGYDFVAGGTLSAIVLDEVDVLLPLPPKTLRTSLDSMASRTKNKGNNNTPQDERRRQEQRRKLISAKRKGVELTNNNKQIVSPTEKLLGLVAAGRFASGSDDDNTTSPPQVLAGSATASRKTLDRLNRALRRAAEQEASSTFDLVWSRDVKACRPETRVDASDDQNQHTIRAVTVPSQVTHQYILLDKESASSASAVLQAVAKAAERLKPQTSLLFLCGQFGKAIINKKKQEIRAIRGATSKARRNAMRKNKQRATRAAMDKNKNEGGERLSARRACKTLATFGIHAQPLHVALGLELNAKDDDDDDEEMMESSNPFFVTFEGSARGLHFDKVDAVFVVGRPASAASYLHLAGRVGRASPNDQGDVVIQPGTVVSICTTGSAAELEKWTHQVGGSTLEELKL